MQQYHMDGNFPPTTPRAGRRLPVHTREVRYRAWAREDGLWDVEGTLLDTKEVRVDRFDGHVQQPGDAVHHMHVVVTVDDALRIVAIDSEMRAIPFGICEQARAPLQRLVGATLGRGWRRSLDEAMGGEAGCTHLRELLLNLATAAIQGVGAYRDQRRREQGLPPLRPAQAEPHFVGGCMSWRRDGPLVARLFPEFAAAPRAASDTPP